MNPIAHWQTLSDRKAAFARAIAPLDPALSREAAAESREASRVALALRMEEATGTPHCACTNPPHPRP